MGSLEVFVPSTLSTGFKETGLRSVAICLASHTFMPGVLDALQP